jgi:hypothetical protein
MTTRSDNICGCCATGSQPLEYRSLSSVRER